MYVYTYIYHFRLCVHLPTYTYIHISMYISMQRKLIFTSFPVAVADLSSPLVFMIILLPQQAAVCKFAKFDLFTCSLLLFHTRARAKICPPAINSHTSCETRLRGYTQMKRNHLACVTNTYVHQHTYISTRMCSTSTQNFWSKTSILEIKLYQLANQQQWRIKKFHLRDSV